MSQHADTLSLRLHGALAANSADLLAYLCNGGVDIREDAADLLGETMLVAWRRVSHLPQEPEGARMWLFVIARNTLLNYRRGRRRSVAAASELCAELVVSAPAEPDAGAAEDVRAAIARLPDDLADAARLGGIPAATARGRYARARSQLQLELSSYTPTP